jgi:plastocyanin
MRAMRARALVGVAILAATGAVGWVPPAHAAPDATTVRVSMKDFAFHAANLVVHMGQTVTWTYDESATDPMPNCESPVFRDPSPVTCPGHNVVSTDLRSDGRPVFSSGAPARDPYVAWSHTFTRPGAYRYYCSVHGGKTPNNKVTHMDGVVFVVP